MGKYDQEIVSAVSLRGTMTVGELADMLGVSDQTVRRIVKPLVVSGQLEKIHGAIKTVENPMTAPFLARMQHNRAAKASIASCILQLIPDGAAIAIDAGSSAGFVAQALQIRKTLTVVTNSVYVASTLSLTAGNRVYFAGTQLRDHDGASYDRTAFETVEKMQVDVCILTAAQVHQERGFLMAEQCEADMARSMAKIAKRIVFAVDHSKFVKKEGAGLLSLGPIEPKPVIVTDRAPAEGARVMNKLGEMTVAGESGIRARSGQA
jgi:DeoR family transcriptional regulator, glycerol-3-phosphate regulon repressor